ncbi:hypothetical protein ABZ630_05145, partial [Streptomyces albidoflavus]
NAAPLTSLDVAAHEMTHGVTSVTAGLICPAGGDAWRAIRRAGAHGDRKRTGYADVSADGDTSTNTGVRPTIASGAGKTGATGGPGRPGDPGTISRQETPS